MIWESIQKRGILADVICNFCSVWEGELRRHPPQICVEILTEGIAKVRWTVKPFRLRKWTFSQCYEDWGLSKKKCCKMYIIGFLFFPKAFWLPRQSGTPSQSCDPSETLQGACSILSPWEDFLPHQNVLFFVFIILQSSHIILLLLGHQTYVQKDVFTCISTFCLNGTNAFMSIFKKQKINEWLYFVCATFARFYASV